MTTFQPETKESIAETLTILAEAIEVRDVGAVGGGVSFRVLHYAYGAGLSVEFSTVIYCW